MSERIFSPCSSIRKHARDHRTLRTCLTALFRWWEGIS